MSIFPSKIEMDVGNGNIIRERSNLFSKSTSRISLILSNTFSISYHEYMEINSNKLENINVESIESPQFFLIDNSNSGTLVSRIADNSSADRSKCVSNKTPTSVLLPPPHSPNNNISKSNNSKQLLMNVNLPYDINQTIDQNT